MRILPFYAYLPSMEPFILFNALVKNKETSCVGYEYYCCDPKCNCKLANIIIHDTSGNRLSHILYGWRDVKYYVKERFVKSDILGFINGSLDLREPENKQNKSLLSAFQLWLSKNKSKNKQSFESRYKKFKSVARCLPYDPDQSSKDFTDSIIEMIHDGTFKKFTSGL